MRISCPSCGAIYEVPETRLGPAPRKLRCARCGAEWTRPAPVLGVPAATHEDEVPQPPPAPAIEPAAREEPTPAITLPEVKAPPPRQPVPATREASRATTVRSERPALPAKVLTRSGASLTFRHRSGATAWAAWIASVVVLLVLVWAGYNFRASVMHAWPASERLYMALGLAPQPPTR